MNSQRVTYGEMAAFLQSLGFERVLVPESRVIYRHSASPASLILPIEKPTAHVSSLHLAMTRSMLVDFGFLSNTDVDRWLADPRSYQAA